MGRGAAYGVHLGMSEVDQGGASVPELSGHIRGQFEPCGAVPAAHPDAEYTSSNGRYTEMEPLSFSTRLTGETFV